MVGRSSQVARGLNTIAANIVANRDTLKEFGVEVESSAGQLNSTFEVLKSLSEVWNELDDTTKVTLGTMLAGKNQYKVLAAVMTNFEHAVEATNSALNSSGTAFKQNEAYMSSIEAKITAVSAAFQQMALKIVDSDLVKGILDIVKAFAELGSTNIGSTITQIILLSGVSWGGLQLLGQSILPGIINSFRIFGNVLKGMNLGEAAQAVAAVPLSLSAGLSAALPVILGATTAIVALVAIIREIKEAYDEAHPSVEEALEQLEQSKSEYQSAEENYENAKQKLEELNATPFEARTSEIQAEIARLQELVAYYEKVKELRESEVKYNAKVYASTVAQSGIPSGKYIVTKSIGSEVGALDGGYDQYKESFNSLEEAIIGAADAYFEFSGVATDLTDLTAAKATLEGLGYTFKENTISVQSLMERMSAFSQYISGENTDILTNATNLQILSNEYESLISLGQDYANALKEIDYRDLTSEQQLFLAQWDSMIQNFGALNNFIEESTADTSKIVEIQTQMFLHAAGALSEYAQNLLAAKNAYELFKASMEESGDYDDSFKGLVSVFEELNGEWEKGQVGSKAFLTALELLTGQTFDAESATQYLNEHLETLQLLFGDSESGGIGLISAMLKLQKEGTLTGASIKKVGDSLEVSITDFSALASSLGISEGSLYALTQALKVLGVSFDYNIEGILDKLSGLGKGVVDFGDKTTVNFEEFVKQAKLAGMSTDEILMIKDVLDGASNVDLTKVTEGMDLITDDADDAAGAANDLEEGLEGVGDTAGGVQNTAEAVKTLGTNLSRASSQANNLYNHLSSLAGLDVSSIFHAQGTDYAQEGNSLVNEEGPELIQSGNKAYIAGGGLPTVTHLHKGDKVYTAEETKDILGGKNVTSIQAHKIGSKDEPSISTTGITGGSASVSPSLLPRTQQALKDALQKYLDGKKGTEETDSGKKGSSTKSSSSQSESKTIKDIFDEWLKAKKHALAMDEITEKEYYEELEKMNEKYFKDSKEYQDEYWKYQEEVYQWRKKQLEEENKLLEKQIDLQKALGELQKAKEQRILVYKDGSFQYIEDIDAISKAVQEVAKLESELGVETGYATAFTTNKKGYANGTLSASAGLHLVGENGPELRVLNSGDGVIPSDVTRNLLSLAGYGNSKFMNGLDRIKQILYSFNIDNLSLPNVSNPTEFFEGLKNYAYQYSYAN